MDDLAKTYPVRVFESLEDPRAGNVRHRLIDVLIMALCGMIAGGDGWDDLERFARAKADWFGEFLDLKHGVPSADTFRRVISSLDPDAFEQAFMAWMQAVVELSQGRLLAIDGKSLRRSFEQAWDKAGMAHLVSVFAAQNGQVLSQLKTDGKGGELDAIKELLGLVDLSGAIVTIDAIGCQKAVAKQIIDAEADYILGLKGNQKSLHHDVKKELDDMIRTDFQGVWHDFYEQTDAGHGRIEVRKIWVIDDLHWLKQAGAWPGLRSVVVVESHREVIGQAPTIERRYFITSLPPDAEQLAGAIRGHWGVENSLHHVLDVTFREDDSRIRRANGAENMSRLRRMALNLLKKAKAPKKNTSLRGKRKLAGWDNEFLRKVIMG